MSNASIYAARCDVAERLQRETGIRCEAVHPKGPIGIAYLVGLARIGCSTAAEARRKARKIAVAERAEIG